MGPVAGLLTASRGRDDEVEVKVEAPGSFERSIGGGFVKDIAIVGDRSTFGRNESPRRMSGGRSPDLFSHERLPTSPTRG